MSDYRPFPLTPNKPGGQSIDSIAFDRAAQYYDQTRGFPAGVSEQVADRLEAAAGPGARFLEIGVGTGRIALPLHQRGRRVFGVDLSIPMLERYRGKAELAGLAPPPVVRADATRLPVRDASVEAVIEVHVLHLIRDWRQALAEVRRVLAPSGVVLVGRRTWERSEGRGPRARARERHAAILAEMGFRCARIGARTDEEVIGAFTALGGHVEELEPVTWREDETWAEYVDILERRVWSESWEIPEDVWQEGSRRLRAELRAEGVDLQAPVPAVRHVEIAAIRL
ncbi:MAG TPA: class I SAM-dependent methyltransferase [Actinomycetes bacterium]|nr:class I SAM-dependent methyltransferase [Actinomycetes bacterium]